MKQLLPILLCIPIFFISCIDLEEIADLEEIINNIRFKIEHDSNNFKTIELSTPLEESQYDFLIDSIHAAHDLHIGINHEVCDVSHPYLYRLKDAFSNNDDYDLIVGRYSHNKNQRFVFSNRDRLGDPNFNQLFNADIGAVIGPYLIGDVFRIAKLVDVAYRPDSVEARHIMIQETDSMNLDSVNNCIYMLVRSIENGALFGELAKKYSHDDASAIRDGDLGWFQEGVMVDEFNEACFTSDSGDLSVITSQFGVHLIQVTRISKAVKKVKIAYIDITRSYPKE